MVSSYLGAGPAAAAASEYIVEQHTHTSAPFEPPAVCLTAAHSDWNASNYWRRFHLATDQTSQLGCNQIPRGADGIHALANLLAQPMARSNFSLQLQQDREEEKSCWQHNKLGKQQDRLPFPPLQKNKRVTKSDSTLFPSISGRKSRNAEKKKSISIRETGGGPSWKWELIISWPLL